MSAPACNVARGAGAVAQRPGHWLHLADQVRLSAQQLVEAVFPKRGLKRYAALGWFPYFGLVRARAGVNCPAARLGSWLVGMRALGLPRHEAMRLAVWMIGWIDVLWAELPDDLPALSRLEQHCQGEEDDLQLRVAHGDVAALPAWIEALERESAAQMSCIVAGRRRLLEREVAA